MTEYEHAVMLSPQSQLSLYASMNVGRSFYRIWLAVASMTWVSLSLAALDVLCTLTSLRYRRKKRIRMTFVEIASTCSDRL